MAEEDAPVKEVEAIEPQKASKKPANLKKIIAISAAVVVALIVIVVVLLILVTSGPKKVADSLVKDIQTKNAAAAYNLFAAEAKTQMPQDQFKQIVDQIGPILNGKPQNQSSETSGEAGSAATATVVYLIKGKDGNTYKFTVNLTKENGGWKVLNFTSTKQ